MTETRLRFRDTGHLPVEAEAISPDRFIGLTQAEVGALSVLRGRRQATISDLFEVKGDGAAEILLEGDLSHVKRIGEGMTQGRITIDGNSGMHLGAHMCGGEIVVHGNAAGWAGAHMAGGALHIDGDAGPMLGGAYTGERRGMRGGVIVVRGNTGIRAGERMRRGLIIVGGDAAEFAGTRMIAGSILVFGQLGARSGAGMKRGTIVTWGGPTEELLPTFRYACVYQPAFMRYYLRRLQAWGLPVADEQVAGFYRRYVGDINTIGKGEILVYDQH
jgi:formylmethanofuran dehydrogenase subunit C